MTTRSERVKVRILGVDPGLAEIGWGVIDYVDPGHLVHIAHGVIRSAADEPLEARLWEISRGFEGALETYRPTHVAYEAYRNYGRVHWNGVQTLYSIGALAALARDQGHTLLPIGAREAKLALGVRDGEKKSVQTRVAALLALDHAPRPTHCSDALAVALSGLAEVVPSIAPVLHGDLHVNLHGSRKRGG
jgi:crossover junction endodeoxyribonuclease RuvC